MELGKDIIGMCSGETLGNTKSDPERGCRVLVISQSVKREEVFGKIIGGCL